MKALHMLHSDFQYTKYASQLAESDIVVVNPSMVDADIRKKIPNCEGKWLIPSFNAMKLYMGAHENQYWERYRGALGKYIYGNAVDPGDPTPHQLFRPTLQLAEDFSKWIERTLLEQGFSSSIYLDDAVIAKTGSVSDVERIYWQTDRTPPEVESQIQVRWRTYLDALCRMLLDRRIFVMANCRGQSPSPVVTSLCCEHDAMDEIMFLRKVIGQAGVNIYWGGNLEVSSVLCKGTTLPKEE